MMFCDQLKIAPKNVQVICRWQVRIAAAIVDAPIFEVGRANAENPK